MRSFSPLVVDLRLEVEAKHELNHSATGIRRGRRILISNCRLSESRIRVGTCQTNCIRGKASNLEVLVVDYVQGLHSEFDILVFREGYFLDQAGIDSGEPCSIDHQVCNAAFSVEASLAIAIARRRDERLSRIWWCTRITCWRRGADTECPNRVSDHIVR